MKYLKIEYLNLDELIPYENNSRKHSEGQLKQLEKSIKENGFTNPLLVDEENNILAGHGRLLAAKGLGMPTVPCVRIVGLSELQKRAYIIADNKLALNADWDEDLLRQEFEALEAEGFDLELTGFSLEEIADLTPEEIAPDLNDEDSAPTLRPDPVNKVGDIWILGKHRLMCGDSTSTDHLAQLSQGHLVDMWLTDPPYNVAYEGRTKSKLTIKNDEMEDEQFRQFLRDAYTAADMIMKPGAVFYIWHADSEGYNFRGAAREVGWKVRQCLIWQKQMFVIGRQDYQWKHEPCLYGWKDGSAHLWTGDRKQTTILEFDRPIRSEEHPTMKPVALFEYLILNNTKAGDLVLDSFGGSGTTLVAAEKNARRALLMEIDPCYCDVIIKRWQDFTGKNAVHEGTGISFNEMKADVQPLDVESANETYL